MVLMAAADVAVYDHSRSRTIPAPSNLASEQARHCHVQEPFGEFLSFGDCFAKPTTSFGHSFLAISVLCLICGQRFKGG